MSDSYLNIGNPMPIMSLPNLTTSTCCYCGVGCGVLIESRMIDGVETITGVQGDPQHPANYGRLCTKGLSLPQTVASAEGRLLTPKIRYDKNQALQPADWDAALNYVTDRFSEIIKEHGPDSVAFYLSGQLLTEDYYVFNKIAKGLIGTNNIDTNSRLCMSSSVAAYKKSLGADGPPTCYEDLEQADCVLFAGSNMAYAHPVLFRRLEIAKQKRGQKWIVIDPRRTDTAAMADLHLKIQPGTDVVLFNAMLHHIIWQGWVNQEYVAASTEGFAALKDLVREYTPQMAANICGVSDTDIMLAAEWFAQNPASLSLYCMGLNQSSEGTNKNLALINLHLAAGQIGKVGAGPFSLTGQVNAMGGREVGGMATMLAAHRDYTNESDCVDVAAHWQVPPERISRKPGFAAIDMFAALGRGDIKAIYIVCTNPAHSMPNLPQVRQALQKAELVVVQDCFSNIDTMAYADVALPATGWGEKEGSVTNSERRISRVRAAVPALGQARGDWQIACDFGRALQAKLQPDEAPLFGWLSSAEIFAEHAALTARTDLDMTGISHNLLEEYGPVQWPLTAERVHTQTASSADNSRGRVVAQAAFSLNKLKNRHDRRYTKGVFATANGKAQFCLTPYQGVAESTSARYPFHLLTGRLRDQWHGMSRTGRVASLFQHAPQPQLTMHPQDALLHNLLNEQLVSVSSKRGSFVLPIVISDEIRQGSVFAAMHWSGQFLNTGGVNESMGDAVCAQSFQPELKHTAVRIEAVKLPWRFMVALRSQQVQDLQLQLQPLLAECAYASLSLAAQDVLVLRAAHDSENGLWFDQLLKIAFSFGLLVDDDRTLNYHDPAKGLYRRVVWQTQTDGSSTLQALAISANEASRDLARFDGLLLQLSEGRPWEGSRLAALNPNINAAAVRDKVICSCKEVKASQIIVLHQKGVGLDAIKEQLGCGTVCGSCVPELKQLCS